jgi:redox-sensitive bicupin YhaK (pirin superfamily)
VSYPDLTPETVAVTPGVVTAVDVIEARKAAIGDGTEVRRLLPQRALRTIGAWCFLDHYGPDDVSRGTGMHVPPHPHIGLQTASWLFDGHILHRDSLGSRQLIRPGELNLMTSGRGIAHAEESPRGRPALLHGLQLWIALPDANRFTEPSFAHHAQLPIVYDRHAAITVVVGEYQGERSPATVYSPLIGLEVAVPPGSPFVVPVCKDFEHGVVSVDGPATVAGADVAPGLLAHLPPGLSVIVLEPAIDKDKDLVRFFILGGEPFPERLIMWWNLVARTPEEIAAARDDWVAGRFAEVRGYPGDPLPAPALPAGRLRPR